MAKKENKEIAIDFKKIYAIMWKNFIVLTRDKTRLLPLLLFPIFMILVFGYTTGSVPKHISTVIIDYDNTPMSASVISSVQANEVFNVRYMVGTEGEARNLLDRGLVQVIIIIPPGLQDDINNGIQKSVTIIVDESDSSVSAITKTTFRSIITRMSLNLGRERTIYFQHSVASSAERLQIYAQSENQYGRITSNTIVASQSFEKAESLLDDNSAHLFDSIPFPTYFVLTSVSDYMTENNTYILKPVGYDANIALVNVMKAASGKVKEGDTLVKRATDIAAAADERALAHQDYRVIHDNVVEPMEQVEEFTTYDANNLLVPLIADEDPAYGTGKRPIDFIIATIIALTIFQGAVMSMGRSVAGEKREGSLTRVFLTPTSNTTIIMGTLIFYIFFEVLRSSFLILIATILFHIQIEGSLIAIGFILIVYAGVSTAIGMILSSMVRTEQQYMGMAMLVSMPTMFLAGAFFPLQAMPKFLQTLAGLLPVTYAGRALQGVMIKGLPFALLWYPIMILCLFFIAFVAILFMVFKRDIE